MTVADGEFAVMVGPSGSGKTSVLRVIAGLDRPDKGTVSIGGEDVTRLPTARRDLAMVFEEGGLQPQRTVRSNIAFPLEIRRTPREEISERVSAEGRALRIEDLLDRQPHELGAGHRQLAQLARAMVRVPAAFLMDEPLARVDAAERIRIRGELRSLQRGYGVTTLYVTNDPVEALALADRLFVLIDGYVEQDGAPMEVYRSPSSVAVAEVVGNPPMNLLPAHFQPEPEGGWLDAAGLRIRIWNPALRDPRPVLLGMWPEDIVIGGGADGLGKVVRIVEHGSHRDVVLDLEGEEISTRTAAVAPTVGEKLPIAIRRWVVFDPQTGRTIATGGD